MKKIKRRRKLLIQITLLIIPVFVIMTAAVVWAVYTSSVNSFLKAQQNQIKDMMNSATSFLPLTEDGVYDEKSRQWVIDTMSTVEIINSEDKLSDEDLKKLNDYVAEKDRMTYNWYKRMPEDIKPLVVQEILFGTKEQIGWNKYSVSNVDSLVIVNANYKDKMRVLIDFYNSDNSEMGKIYDIDISEHSVLNDAFESGTEEMLFENTNDMPFEGNYLVCYRPVIISGKTAAVLGITYNWNDMRRSVIHTTISVMVIIIIGAILLMTLMIVFLYRRTIKPVRGIQNALIEYTDDKSTPEIVKKMYNIASNNELGYLSDVISDMALEIDLYTKENVRIAVAKERAEREAYEARVAVMASQIRPHFMYNALTSIAMMCQIDPEKAQEATITFAKYLRGNMDSLKQTKPVPFETELDHLKKYLYIEQMRFGKKLNVVYDIQATDFKLPMLSVQPLVENAVKHGVGMKKKGGTVTISTKETDTAFVIIISDDGVGFDMNAPKKDDGRSHVGMENTRTRLREMCAGEIKIESTVDVGTAATITLPKEEQDNEDTVS